MIAKPIAIGQRWHWKAGGLDFIAETQSERDGFGCVHGLVIQGNYSPGRIYSFYPFPETTMGDHRWSYLEGQDKSQ